MARRYTDLQLACAVAESKNVSDVCRRLGIVPRGGNYSTVKRRIEGLGLSTDHFTSTHRRNGRRVIEALSDDDFAALVRSSRSVAGVLKGAGLSGQTEGRRTVHRRIEAQGLDTSHFLGAGWRAGCTDPVRPAKPLSEVLVRGRPYSSHTLRRRLIREGVKKAACERCGRSEWLGQAIRLELDHINGRSDDNRLENLRILCPNCHSQTETYRGRNIGMAGY
jgi:Zn finger protein HypA/HybF involved in hydrogenase expression